MEHRHGRDEIRRLQGGVHVRSGKSCKKNRSATRKSSIDILESGCQEREAEKDGREGNTLGGGMGKKGSERRGRERTDGDEVRGP